MRGASDRRWRRRCDSRLCGQRRHAWQRRRHDRPRQQRELLGLARLGRRLAGHLRRARRPARSRRRSRARPGDRCRRGSCRPRPALARPENPQPPFSPRPSGTRPPPSRHRRGLPVGRSRLDPRNPLRQRRQRRQQAGGGVAAEELPRRRGGGRVLEPTLLPIAHRPFGILAEHDVVGLAVVLLDASSIPPRLLVERVEQRRPVAGLHRGGETLEGLRGCLRLVLAARGGHRERQQRQPDEHARSDPHHPPHIAETPSESKSEKRFQVVRGTCARLRPTPET